MLVFTFLGSKPTPEVAFAWGSKSTSSVGRREPQVDSDEVQTELERLRESLASLETVERAAASGDFVVMDFTGTVDGEAF